MKTGIVEKIAFTSSGAGSQWTTISGVRYATWWNLMSMDWKVGDRVEFEDYTGKLFHGMAPIACARKIRKVKDSNA